MPELPEVERARRLVEEHCCGRTVLRVVAEEQGGGPRTGLFDDIVHADCNAEQTAQAFTGRTILAAHRKGKQLWLELSGAESPDSKHPLLHFGMTGALVVKGVKAMQYKSFSVSDTWPPRFCKLELELSGGVHLAFCDPRRLGRIQWRTSPALEPPIRDLAPDPLLQPPPVEDFCRQLATMQPPIKAVLLDQNRVVSGIGNWIADEVLFQAAIHPSTRAAALTNDQAQALHSKVGEVCQLACDANADSGRFPASWLFHHRWSKGSKGAALPDGRPIVFETVGGRTSAIVPAVQVLSAAPKLPKAPAAPKARNPKKAVGSQAAEVVGAGAVQAETKASPQRAATEAAANPRRRGSTAQGKRSSDGSAAAPGGERRSARLKRPRLAS